MTRSKNSAMGLSKRARRFVSVHGIWLDASRASQWRQHWQDAGVASDVINHAERFQSRWGGLALPAAPGLTEDAAGPRKLDVGDPELKRSVPDVGWWFEAGPQRTAVPYSFLVGPDGAFGIAGGDDERWVPLHSSVEGWIESLAMTYAVADVADTVTRLTGSAVDELDLTAMRPIAEVGGAANGWWYRRGSLVAIYAGESVLFGRPSYRTAFVYTGNIDLQRL